MIERQVAHIRELEGELRRCREECEAERALRRELEERQVEEARAEAEARHNEIQTRLGDIQNPCRTAPMRIPVVKNWTKSVWLARRLVATRRMSVRRRGCTWGPV